jgi:hypothetical protein
MSASLRESLTQQLGPPVLEAKAHLKKETTEMKNFLMLTIIMALTTVCVPAQQRDDEVTFSDHQNQSITVSRFGTVMSFIDRNGNKMLPKHTYRICPCNTGAPCFESQAPTNEASADLSVVFPAKGKKLKQGQSLKIQATVHLPGRTVIRRLVWKAGSSTVHIQTLTWSLAQLCCIGEQSVILIMEHHGCSMPPPDGGFSFSCPPPPVWFSSAPRNSSQHSATFILDFSAWGLSNHP